MRRNLRAEAFLNALRILHNTSADDIRCVASDFQGSHDAQNFAKDPFMWLMKAQTDVAQAVYEQAIEPKQPARLRDKMAHVYFGCDLGTGEMTVKALAVAVSDADGSPIMWRVEEVIETPDPKR